MNVCVANNKKFMVQKKGASKELIFLGNKFL